MVLPDLTEDEIVSFVKENYGTGKSGIKFEDDLLYGSADYRIYLLGITVALMYAEIEGKGGRA